VKELKEAENNKNEEGKTVKKSAKKSNKKVSIKPEKSIKE